MDRSIIELARERARIAGISPSSPAAPRRFFPVSRAERDLNASIAGAPNVAKLFQNSLIQGIEAALGKDIGGAEAALQRPEVREQAGTLRKQLLDQAQQARAENMRLQALGMRASQPVASPQQIDEQVKTAIAGMADNQIPYQALTKLRTVVGKELDNYSLADSVPRDKWKRCCSRRTRGGVSILVD